MIISLLLVLALTLVGSPMLFERLKFVNSFTRLYLGILALVFLALGNKRFHYIDILILFFVLGNFCIEFLWKSKVQNILSYLSIILVYALFFRLLKLEKVYQDLFLKMWVKLGYIASFVFLSLFFLNQFTSINTDIFNLESLLDLSPNNFKFHLMGITLNKIYGSSIITRVYGFFVEPQYAGFYFTMNLLIACYIGKFRNKKLWVLMNLLAGTVTFSSTFFLSLIPISVLAFTGNNFRFVFYLMLTIFSLFCIFEYENMKQMEILNLTSFGDREDRIRGALVVLEKATQPDFYFGHGVDFQNTFGGKPFSAGFFVALVERGLIGLLFVFIMIFCAIGKKYTAGIILLLYLLAAPLYVNYLFWISILAIWAGAERGKELREKRILANP
ncbi:MAG: hypothetical protein L6Q54_05185 [Leptospiraceae bacterium]|nr:hypothetical protein [Leptospiraceae bacterium]MCK6380631.1 hypothetical protein [Leptospiraceae bacterium]